MTVTSSVTKGIQIKKVPEVHIHTVSMSRNRAREDGGMISGSVKCIPLTGACCRWLMERSRSYNCPPSCRVVAEQSQLGWRMRTHIASNIRGVEVQPKVGRLPLIAERRR